MKTLFQKLEIQSYSHLYSVEWIESIRTLITELLKNHSNSVILIDAQVATLYHQPLSALLTALPVFKITATETEKTLTGVEKGLNFLQQHNATKKTHVICIGGGIVQDICTMICHLYYRGIGWTYIPTTLLAMSDSCIGSKASINFGQFKNQLGAFHAPSQIFICPEFLLTLSQDELASGYGEILKLLAIGNRPLFMTSKDSIQNGGFLNQQTAEHLYECLKIKKSFIEEDEFDRGIRNILNYGHTFGHAIESLSNFQIPHGIAIGIGMDIENWIALQLGHCSKAEYDCMHHILKTLFFSFLLPRHNIQPTLLWEKIRRDKKVTSNAIQIPLLKSIGQAKLFTIELNPELLDIVKQYFNCELDMKQVSTEGANL